MSKWQLKAIQQLNPDASFDTELDANGEIVKVNWKEDATPTDLSVINSKAEEIKKAEQYKDLRAVEYRKLGFLKDQLDMIYHDFDDWKAKIKAVKDKYPKED
jgi:hypothetical protein